MKKVQRFDGLSKKSGWRIDRPCWSMWGDWVNGDRYFSKDDIITFEEVRKEQKEIREAGRLIQKTVAIEAQDFWENKSDRLIDNGYLARKKVKAYNTGYYAPDIYIPLCDVHGKIWNMQKITPDGKKFFLKGGRVKGCMFRIGSLDKITLICEGYATAASLHEITGLPVIAAFNAGNLIHVCGALKRKHKDVSFWIAADNDILKLNTGFKMAMKCHREHHVGIAVPKFKVMNEKTKDFNDLYVYEGAEKVKQQILGVVT